MILLKATAMSVSKTLVMPGWLKSYLRQPFVMIVWFMETYTKNTTRLRIFMTNPGAIKAFKIAITFTMLVWIVVGFMASDEDRGRLTEKIRTTWGELQN